MKSLTPCLRSPSTLISIALAVLVTAALPAAEKKEKTNGTSKYVVLMVTNHEGKTSYKPLADEKQEQFRKDTEDEYQKARKAFQEAKKAFEKENKGEKYGSPEPVKPKIKVVKKDLKTFPDARQVALDLEKAANGNGKNGNGKNGKNGSEKSDK